MLDPHPTPKLARRARADEAKPNEPMAQPSPRKVSAKNPGSPSANNGTPRPWYTQPRGYVWLVLLLALAAGGGRKLLQSIRARRLVRRLGEGELDQADILAAADHGRLALPELFELLEVGRPDSIRRAAGQALMRLWSADELIAEEEKAVTTRLFNVHWHARRRYPGKLQTPIHFNVAFGLLGLEAEGAGLQPHQLEWSWRIRGAARVSLEQFTPWQAVQNPIRFEIDSVDLQGSTEKSIAFQARVRTAGLTSRWELDLPQVPFRFELDDRLEVSAILTTPDAQTEELIKNGVQLELLSTSEESGNSSYIPIDPSLAIAGELALNLEQLPADLAHQAILEFENLDLSLSAGAIVKLSGMADGPARKRVPVQLKPVERTTVQPGTYRVRLILSPNPDLGWAHADVRAVWPQRIETDWQQVHVVRI